MRLQNLTSACSIVIAGLPMEEKQRLLCELAHECGYVIRLESRELERSTTTHYPTAEEGQMAIEFEEGAKDIGNTSPGE
jgi:hypothetical protein